MTVVVRVTAVSPGLLKGDQDQAGRLSRGQKDLVTNQAIAVKTGESVLMIAVILANAVSRDLLKRDQDQVGLLSLDQSDLVTNQAHLVMTGVNVLMIAAPMVNAVSRSLMKNDPPTRNAPEDRRGLVSLLNQNPSDMATQQVIAAKTKGNGLIGVIPASLATRGNARKKLQPVTAKFD